MDEKSHHQSLLVWNFNQLSIIIEHALFFSKLILDLNSFG